MTRKEIIHIKLSAQKLTNVRLGSHMNNVDNCRQQSQILCHGRLIL